MQYQCSQVVMALCFGMELRPMRLGLGEGIRALHQSGVVDLFIGTDTLTVRWFLKKVGIPKATQDGWGLHGRS